MHSIAKSCILSLLFLSQLLSISCVAQAQQPDLTPDAPPSPWINLDSSVDRSILIVTY